MEVFLLKRPNKTGELINDAKGFSLMELVIIIAILAILSVLLVPRIISITKESKRNRDIANARIIAGDVASYNALANKNGVDTIPASLTGTQELTKAMLDSTSLALSDLGSFPDPSIVKIYVDSNGNTLIEVFD